MNGGEKNMKKITNEDELEKTIKNIQEQWAQVEEYRSTHPKEKYPYLKIKKESIETPITFDFSGNCTIRRRKKVYEVPETAIPLPFDGFIGPWKKDEKTNEEIQDKTTSPYFTNLAGIPMLHLPNMDITSLDKEAYVKGRIVIDIIEKPRSDLE